jgi:membrane protein YdbS with pleckstrin-like domain
MSLGKQIILAISIYIVFAVIIEVFLWYFNPLLNEYLRVAIIASPILISIILTKIIVERNKTKRDD